MFDIQPEHVFTSAGAAGGIVWMWSKLRLVLAKDSLDASVSSANKSSVETLRDENIRLHDEVIRLRSEVDRLREVITELTRKLTEMSMLLQKNTVEDQLAREGRLLRRKTDQRSEGPFDSRTQPGPLPVVPAE